MSLKNQLDMLIKGLVTLSLTLSVWVMCLDLSHSQSGLSPDFTLNSITTVTEKNFSSFTIQEISIHDNSTLLVLNSDNVVVNRIGSYQYGAMKVCYYVAFVMAIYMVFISSVMLVQKKNRKLIAFALLTVTLLFLTGALTNLVFSAKVVLSPELQLVIILFIFSLYLKFYSVFHRSTQSNTALLAFASQSGSAFSIAKRIHALVPETFDLRCLSTLSPDCLNQYQKVFLIASTYGQGQPPEKALSFINQMKRSESFNSSFEFSILALGDRTYQHFCAFGHQVAQLFKDKGARPINDVVEVDKMDKDAIAKWWQVVSRAIGVTNNKASITTNGMIETCVLSNTQANPNNQKRAAHYLSLSRGNLNYQAGDLLEVIPKLSKEKCLKMIHHHGLNADDTVMYQGQQTSFIEAIRQSDWLGETADTPQKLIDQLKPLPLRVYSIASSPYDEAKIDIFVRRLIKNDGSVGIASDYLCNLSADDELTVSIRSHPNFHLPSSNVPIIMIGAGTGIAPLIALLKTREHMNQTSKNWLFFGEQFKASDFYFEKDITSMFDSNHLDKFTTAWSQEGDGYIQDKVYASKSELKKWVDELNAVIYICGKLKGFGNDVVNCLKTIFGVARYQALIRESQIRVDLY